MGCNFQFGVVQLTRSILLQCRHYCRKVVGTRRKWHQRALWLRPCTLCRLRRFQIQPPFVLAFVRFRTTDDERKQVETTTTIKHNTKSLFMKVWWQLQKFITKKMWGVLINYTVTANKSNYPSHFETSTGKYSANLDKFKHSFQPIRRKNEPNRDLVRLVFPCSAPLNLLWHVVR